MNKLERGRGYGKVGVVQTVVENVDQIGEGNVGTDDFVQRKEKQIAHFAIMGIITHNQLTVRYKK